MSSFGDRERQRQATFRVTSPTIRAHGRAPSDEKGRCHGHLLALGHEEENLYPSLRGAAGARRFFEERAIRWHRTATSGDTRGGDGPTRNLASSQVACVNFLLPLVEIPGTLAAALRALDSDVRGIVDIRHNGRMSPLEFEWIGLTHSLEGGRTRGANTTSVDAFLIADTDTGRRAYLIEWKYTEDGGSSDKGAGKSGEKRRRIYTPRYEAASSAFSGVVPMSELLYEPFYQLLRLRLLADRMVTDGELGISEAKVVVVVPEGNLAYREQITSPLLTRRFPHLHTVADVMRATLKQPDTSFASVCPSLLLEAVEQACGAVAALWAAYYRERYG